MKTYPLLLLPLLAGCLSSAPKAPTNWTIDFSRTDARSHFADIGKSVRVAAVDVRAPYEGQRLAVLRLDGSIAFDSFNAFASAPTQLLRGAASDEIEASGRFGCVLPSSSAAQTEYTIEIVVTQLALDCRDEDKRTARVALKLLLLKDRQVVAITIGEGAAEEGPVAGDYSAMFSTAFAKAMSEALGKLPEK